MPIKIEQKIAGFEVVKKDEEPKRAEHRAVIGDRDRRHPVLLGNLEDGRRVGVELRRFDPGGPVEQRVFGVDVKVDEALVGHRSPIASGGKTRPQSRE